MHCVEKLALNLRHSSKGDQTLLALGTWKPGGVDRELRTSVCSGMSIDDPTERLVGSHNERPITMTIQVAAAKALCHFLFAVLHCNISEKDEQAEKVERRQKRRPRLNHRRCLPRLRHLSRSGASFKNKQKEYSSFSGGGGGKPIVGRSVESLLFSSDAHVSSTVPLSLPRSLYGEEEWRQ